MKNADYKKLLSALKLLGKTFKGDAEVEAACSLIGEKILAIEVEEEKHNDGETVMFEVPTEVVKTQGVALFSDGACRGNPGAGSWAYVVQGSDGSVLFEESSVADFTTNNKMELGGAIAALEYSLRENLNDTSIFLYTDSTYVVKGITEWVKGWKARGWKKADKKEPENLELWKKLDELASHFSNLNWRWVKGHNGHPQNERCDQLANEALDAKGY